MAVDPKIIHDNKRIDKTYISHAFQHTRDIPGVIKETFNMRVISRVIDSDDQYAFAKIKDEIILRKTGKGRQEIRATIFEEDRGINVLNFQRYSLPSGKPLETSFSFVGKEVETVFYFIKNIINIPINTPINHSITDHELSKVLDSKENIKQFIMDNQDVISELISTELTKEDIIALGYRKKQLDVFSLLLNDYGYFSDLKARYSVRGDEGLWQKFFEKNTWIFGYGLSYIFNTALDEAKLEQVVAGSDFNSSGKRIDALLKTKGLIESFCFGEIKTHKTPLLKPVSSPYRPESWQVSDELIGAIAQVQRTVQKSLTKIGTKTEIKDKNGNPTGEKIFLYTPKSFIVIGSLAEFASEHGINEDKYSSFEMFRQGLNRIEIITFDELFERASFIVKNNERNI